MACIVARVRLLPLVLLAACGGAAAPSTTTPKATGAASEEDWRGYLAQLAGAPCRWIAGASFVACSVDDGPLTLIGWEAIDRRYVAWRVNANGVQVLAGAAGNAGWSFEGPDGQIMLTRVDDRTWTATGLAIETITVTTDGAPPPSPIGTAKPDEDWRNRLHPIAATWTFTGTAADGSDVMFGETCSWIPTSTFLHCGASDGFSLIGYEPHNGRYVRWTFAANGTPEVLEGTVANGSWTFTGARSRMTMTRVSPLEYTLHEETLDGGAWATVRKGAYITSAGE